MKIIADREWRVTRDGFRVERGDGRGLYLLVGKGCEIDDRLLAEYPEAKAIKGPPEDKALKGPREKR